MPQGFFLGQTAPIPVHVGLAGTQAAYLEIVSPTTIVWADDGPLYLNSLSIPVSTLVTDLTAPGSNYTFDGSTDAYLVVVYKGDTSTNYAYFVKRSLPLGTMDYYLTTYLGAGTYEWGILCQIEGTQVYPYPQAAGNGAASGLEILDTFGTDLPGTTKITFLDAYVTGSPSNAFVQPQLPSVLLQAGSVGATIASGNATATGTVTFPLAYSGTPIVVTSGADTTYITSPQSVTRAGFTAKVETWGPVLTTTACTVYWHAVLGGSAPEVPSFISSSIISPSPGTPFCVSPFLCVAATGTYFATYGSGTGMDLLNSDLVVQTSTNGGVTWSGVRTLLTHSTGHQYAPGGMLRTTTGRLIIPYVDTDHNGTTTFYRTYVLYSDDNGATWTSSAALAAYGDGTVVGGNVIQHSSGTLIMTVYCQTSTLYTSTPPPACTTYTYCGVITSTDNGTTWSAVTNIDGTNNKYDESQVTELSGGILALYIRFDVDPDPIYVSYSYDVGATWSTPIALGWNVTPGMPGVFAVQGTSQIIMFYRHITDEYAYWVYSNDSGASWSAEGLYSAGVYYYAGMCLLSSGVLGGVVCVAGGGNPYVDFFLMNVA